MLCSRDASLLVERLKVGKLARILGTHHEESTMAMQSPVMGSDAPGAPLGLI